MNVNQMVKDRPQEKETVKVVIRCRPLSKNEMVAGHEVVVKMNLKSNDILVHKPTGDEPPKQFTFDMVFDWTVS